MFFRKTHPCVGYAYGVITGAYVGEMFVYIETNENIHKFISIPKNINREVPKEKFDFGLNNKILEPVEKLPKYIYEILKKQYIHNYKEELNK